VRSARLPESKARKCQTILVTETVCSCFATLRQISSIRHSLSRPALLTLIRALVISKLDYCCSVLAGAPETLLHRLQSVLNAAARLVFSVRKTEHTSPLLRELHWLKVRERIKFRSCVLTYRCLHGTAPSYLAETIRPVSGLATRRSEFLNFLFLFVTTQW